MHAILKNSIFRILIPLALFASAFLVPVADLRIDTTDFLTTVSVLFAIMLGFFIATATTNYLNFQTSLADEGTALIMLFNLGSLVRPSARERLSDEIDRYLTATLDFSLTNYVEKTEREYADLVAYIDTLEPEDEGHRRLSALESLETAKVDFLRGRTAITFAAKRVTQVTHWTVIIVLGALLVALVFGQRDGGMFANATAGALFAALYLILLLLHEVDGNVFLEEQLAYKDVQAIFRAIGKPNYYPDFAIEQGFVTPPSQSYRIGVRKGPDSTEKEIRTIRP